MHQHYWNLEAVLKTGHGLRGKPDFWHQDQGLFTLFENMVNDLQVNFSFAAACNAVQQGNGARGGGQNLLEALMLFVCQG